MNGTDPTIREELSIAVIAMLVACTIAANEISDGGVLGWISSYAYWITRILIESMLFLAVLYAVEKFNRGNTQPYLNFSIALLVSLVPFSLAITTFDLILGMPELGLDGTSQSEPRFSAFALELVYLFDNHLFLCLLLLSPRLLWPVSAAATDSTLLEDSIEDFGEGGHTPADSTLLSAIDPPLSGHIMWIEAQEHYIRISTTEEKRMVLNRFSDAIRELPSSSGMQVHRSHWVAYSAFESLHRDGQNLKLLLTTGEQVPVSRSYRQLVEERF